MVLAVCRAVKSTDLGRLRIYCLLLTAHCLLLSQDSAAQFTRVPIGPGKISTSKKHSTTSRTQSLAPMKLPFWDDFSFTQEQDYPNDTLWVSCKTVWVNNGIGINPPSIFTAAFDGIDSTGKPYNITDVLAKGFADRLISRPIQLGTLDASQADSVYLSFFYQVTGHGEAPDTDDNFSLWFTKKNNTWEKVFEVTNSLQLDPTQFYYSNIKVDTAYFHENFQFKFQNFARLSGPYDDWNLDYIYLNKRRSAANKYFPDRTLAKPLTTIFKKYTSIPIKHYKDTAKTVTISPTATFYNLYQNNQPSDYSSYAEVLTKIGPVTTRKAFQLDATEPLNDLVTLAHHEAILNKSIPVDSLNLSADSIYIDFKLGFDSGDTNYVAETPLFRPIDFVRNDTIHAKFFLGSNYAYDDGSAEYGAGMNSPGSSLAYGFDMFTKKPDTVVAVDIYFPQFGDNTNRTVVLKIWNDTDGLPNTELHRETITVQRTTANQFTNYVLSKPVGVRNRFYLGWDHTSVGVIPAGLDQNTNSSEEMFFNTTGSWEQNQNVIGSLMIRPIFGKGDGRGSVVTEVEQAIKPSVYPNPNAGEFNMPTTAENIFITTMLGESKIFTVEHTLENKRISLQDRTSGMIVVRWLENGKPKAVKVLVRN